MGTLLHLLSESGTLVNELTGYILKPQVKEYGPLPKAQQLAYITKRRSHAGRILRCIQQRQYE